MFYRATKGSAERRETLCPVSLHLRSGRTDALEEGNNREVLLPADDAREELRLIEAARESARPVERNRTKNRMR